MLKVSISFQLLLLYGVRMMRSDLDSSLLGKGGVGWGKEAAVTELALV